MLRTIKRKGFTNILQFISFVNKDKIGKTPDVTIQYITNLMRILNILGSNLSQIVEYSH
jgi:hypothetical protein